MKKFISIVFAVLIIAACSDKKPEWEVVAENLTFPEGPAYSFAGNYLLVSNSESNWIARISSSTVDTFASEFLTSLVKPNGMKFREDGRLFVCDQGQPALLSMDEDGNATVVVAEFEHEKFNRPNDLTFDEMGNVYFTDPHTFKYPDGRIFYYNFETDELALCEDSLYFGNGIGISPVDGHLYVNESVQHRVLQYKIDGPGKISGKTVFVELPGGEPDGLDFDADGNLLVAHFGTGTIFVISPKGEIIKELKAPGKNTTNVEFGNREKSVLFVTDAETNKVYKTKY